MAKKYLYGLGIVILLILIVVLMGKTNKPAEGGAPAADTNSKVACSGDVAQGETVIFSWQTSQGMTPEAKPKSLTVYSTGRVVGNDVPGGEKNLGAAFASSVARRIELEQLMTATCKTAELSDAGITYTIYSGGQKREIKNPSGDCATSLNVLSGIIDQKLK